MFACFCPPLRILPLQTPACVQRLSVCPSVRPGVDGTFCCRATPPNPPPCWLLMKDGLTSCLAGSLRDSTESSAAPPPRLHTNSASFTGRPPVNTGCCHCCLQAAHESHVQVSARPACLLAFSFFSFSVFFPPHRCSLRNALTPDPTRREPLTRLEQPGKWEKKKTNGLPKNGNIIFTKQPK